MHLFGGGEETVLSRDCMAIQIPDGTAILLEKGHTVFVTQILGGMFTVETELGYLARVDGKDADALGMETPAERYVPSQDENKPVSEQVWDQLRTCYDPEIPINIVELGLIYECQVIPLPAGAYRVEVQMTLTAPGCGMGNVLKTDVQTKLLEIPKVQEVDVEVVFDPPWDSAMMSEAARLQLGML